MGAPGVSPALLRARPGLRRLVQQLEAESVASEERLSSAAALLASTQAEYHRALLLRSHVLGARLGGYDALADAARVRAFSEAQAARLVRALGGVPGLLEECGWGAPASGEQGRRAPALPHAEALRRCRDALASALSAFRDQRREGGEAAREGLLRGLAQTVEGAVSLVGRAELLGDSRLSRLEAAAELRAVQEREACAKAAARAAEGSAGEFAASSERADELQRVSRELSSALRVLQGRLAYFPDSDVTAATRDEYQSLHYQRESLRRLVQSMAGDPGEAR